MTAALSFFGKAARFMLLFLNSNGILTASFPRKDVIAIVITSASLPAKRRILTVCVKLFLEKGYRKTTVAEIVRKADVSNSTFQNIFRAKDGVLTELVEFMFSHQFSMARRVADSNLPPVFIYAVETSIQLTLTELNESLREVYLEAYRQPQSADYIYRHTASELYQIFGSYLPSYSECDFYEQDIGSSGIMRAYMERPCDLYFTLEKKLSRFLTMSMRAYCVPPDEQQQVLAFIETLDIRGISEQVMQELFRKLEMRFSFSLGNS